MHVAIDAHNLLTDERGIGVYVRAVTARFLQRRDCSLTLLVRGWFPARKHARLASLLGSDDFEVAAHVPRKADVTWHPWNGVFFEGPAPNAVTMHDVAPFAFPARYPRRRAAEQEPFLRSARIGRRFAADSVFTRAQMGELLGIDPDAVAVVPLAADAAFSPGAFAAPPESLRGVPYLLYVGAVEPRKNTERLAEAWRRAFPRGGVRLAFVAPHAPDGVIALPALDRSALVDCYRGAIALAFPSLYEGFGLPALEAMACGTPVVASRRASLPEVCGEAALYIDDPEDVEEIARALRSIVEDAALRTRLREAGLRRAATFSWERTAQETFAMIRSAAS